jgi:ribosomal protein L18
MKAEGERSRRRERRRKGRRKRIRRGEGGGNAQIIISIMSLQSIIRQIFLPKYQGDCFMLTIYY